jgi:hypothetical protein
MKQVTVMGTFLLSLRGNADETILVSSPASMTVEQ